MSKLYYRLNSLSKYLKCNKLLDKSYEPIIKTNKSDSEIIEEYMKLFSLLDLSYNVPFNDKHKEFIDEYKEDLIIRYFTFIFLINIKKL
jgi:lipid II:glycine glycyltransferase (peptidoglycan interpeptide bridge formation enzyme)